MAAIAGGVVVGTGWLPVSAAREVAVDRGAPILLFLVAITVLAELADRAGVFDAAAEVCARAARGSTAGLFVLMAMLGTVTTIGMSLDTTAVLLTPVVLAVTTRLGLAPLPFALLAVWLANTASLLLPVSNLTNLLALQHNHLSTLAFAERMWLPELVAVVITVGYLAILFRRDVRGRYQVPARQPVQDKWTFVVAAAGCVALAPLVLAGLPPWAAAAPGVAATVMTFALRKRSELRWSLVPWRLLVMTEGLFLAVTAITRHGLADLLSHAAGESSWRTTAVAAAAANAVNNLPAYLAVESTIPPGAGDRLLSALIGTNCGPLIFIWGSLATLLWLQRCRARGLHVHPARFAAIGLGGTPLVLGGVWAALTLTG